MALAQVNQLSVPITHLSLPKRRVLTFTTTRGNVVQLKLGKLHPRLPLRFVDVLQAPVQYGPDVLLYALSPDDSTVDRTVLESIACGLVSYALYPGASVYLIDNDAPQDKPVDAFVIQTVNVS